MDFFYKWERRASDVAILGLERVGSFPHCMVDQYEVEIRWGKR